MGRNYHCPRPTATGIYGLSLTGRHAALHRGPSRQHRVVPSLPSDVETCMLNELLVAPQKSGRAGTTSLAAIQIEKIGRATLSASHLPSKPLPHEARREPRPPDLLRF